MLFSPPGLSENSRKYDWIKKTLNSYSLLVVALLLSTSLFAQTESTVTAVVNSTTGYLEIRNGFLGIVIPWDKVVNQKKFNIAPIQSIIYSDGTYSDNSLNLLTAASPVVSMQAKWIRKNAQEVTVKLEYRFQKKKYEYYGMKFKNADEGPGFYNCTITIRKGEKLIIVEEDTDYDITYSVKISNGLNPDRARYRGWESYSVKEGYEPDGTIYRSEEKRGYPLDATINIDCSKNELYPRLHLWEQAGGEVNTGRYWQLYNYSASISSNLFGFFHGKPSLLIGAKHSGPRLKTMQNDIVEKQSSIAEILIDIQRRAPDNDWQPRKRFQWIMFVSTKADLVNPEKIQPIARELNRFSGLGDVIRDYANRPGRLIPAFYDGAIYVSAERIKILIKKIKEDQFFHQRLIQLDGTYKAIWDAWRYRDSAISLIKNLIAIKENLEKEYITGEGIYKNNNRYWKGARNFKYYSFCISGIFADKTIAISNTDKVKLEQFVVMMARILWDNNNVPLFDSAGVNFGPSNMIYQYRNNGRFYFALLLANDPEFSKRGKMVVTMVEKDLDEAIYANGASFGTPHYTQATIDPILFSLLQIKQAGIKDVFANNELIKTFSKFYISLLTPPSVRFSKNRKLISFGDGSEESVATFGLLATGLRETDRHLSDQLLNIFFNGPERFSYAGPVPFAIDLLANKQSNVPIEISNCNYSGYMSNFRSGLNTLNESSLWILNGDDYYDHRNDDAGEVAIYALGAPLSLSRSSFYYPSATDARIRSVVVPEKLFPEWNSASQPVMGRSLTNRTWPVSDNILFANLGKSVISEVRMTSKEGKVWHRRVMALNLHDQLPIYFFYDSITGQEKNVWSMMMMSEGTVTTSVGQMQSEKRVYNNEGISQLPASGSNKNLLSGWNSFFFTGQHWRAHHTGGINWYLYNYSSKPQDCSLAQWTTTWQNGEEQNEFYQTNGRKYSEEQQILRIRGENPFFSVLLPHLKNDRYYQNSVKMMEGGKLQIDQINDEIILSPFSVLVTSSNKLLLCLFDANKIITSNGFTLAGGQSELEYSDSLIRIRIHGNNGIRKIQIPFPVLPIEKYPSLSISNKNSLTDIAIEFVNRNNNLRNGENGYQEFIFRRNE
ncbi:MAG: hypothetical protein ACKVOW_06940 [Chitinophagaceae bacterium]